MVSIKKKRCLVRVDTELSFNEELQMYEIDSVAISGDDPSKTIGGSRQHISKAHVEEMGLDLLRRLIDENCDVLKIVSAGGLKLVNSFE